MIYKLKNGNFRQSGPGGTYPVNNGDPQCDVDEDTVADFEYYQKMALYDAIDRWDR